jgi:mRNA interferase MazF
MHEIRISRLDKTRPAVILTRDLAVGARAKVTVAPIYSRGHGWRSEVEVGLVNGLDHACVVNCDDITTIRLDDLGRHVGFLTDAQEIELAEAIVNAFDLRVEELP